MKNFNASLELSQEKARELGHALEEHLVDYQARLASLPVVKVESAAALRAAIWDDLPARGTIAACMQEQGFALVLTTELRGQTVLRLCTINPRTTEEDIVKTVEALEKHARNKSGLG